MNLQCVLLDGPKAGFDAAPKVRCGTAGRPGRQLLIGAILPICQGPGNGFSRALVPNRTGGNPLYVRNPYCSVGRVRFARLLYNEEGESSFSCEPHDLSLRGSDALTKDDSGCDRKFEAHVLPILGFGKNIVVLYAMARLRHHVCHLIAPLRIVSRFLSPSPTPTQTLFTLHRGRDHRIQARPVNRARL